jgi:tetratricopeptide (TPR) repeat protein
MLRAAYPGGHAEIAEALTALARTCALAERWEEALALHLEVAQLHERFHGPDHTTTASTKESIGEIYRKQQRFDLAEHYLRDAVRVFSAQAGDQSLMTMRARVKLGDVLRAGGRYRDAEALLLAGYEALSARRMPHGGAPVRQLALTSLVQLYEAQGRDRDAAKYRALLTTATPTAARPPTR